MEFCELGDLSYFIKKRDSLSRHATTADMIRKYPNPAAGGLNEVVVRHFLKQLASALEFLRQKNFIHRDVKPQNLLLDPSPQYYRMNKPSHTPYAAHEKSMVSSVGIDSLPTLKLADFGFARSLPSTSLAETLCGSPLYMAPEILRYEKYDASADLWSVGTVLYEMMIGKPPFRAANHVELLRKIERGEDRIRFPEEVCLSDSMKRLIRNLLKKNPVVRMSFADFFNNTLIKDEIPGLVEGDRPAKPPRIEEMKGSPEQSKVEGKRPESAGRELRQKVSAGALSQSPQRQVSSGSPKTAALRAEPNIPRPQSGTPPRTTVGDLREKRNSRDMAKEAPKDNSLQARRPSMTNHATAPARHDLHAQSSRNAATVAMRRQSSNNSPTPRSPASQERLLQRERQREARETRERAAQDVAFERDYVLIDKRNVEVNAFADELAASPRIYSTQQPDANRGAMVRRATTQNPPNSTTGGQVAPSRAMHLITGKPNEQMHQRQSSYERRIRDGQSATSAISKAINMASGRLFNLGYSPPLGLGRVGHSPPSPRPFPAYPTSGTPRLIKDGSKAPVPLDEDAKTIQLIEDSATRSNVVYGFAEVKLMQIVPTAPSIDQGLGIQPDGSAGEPVALSSADEELDTETTVTVAEEGLVLYVKALALLARSINIAEAWWAKKKRGEIVVDSALPRTPPKSSPSVEAGTRVNNVVQWVRTRFNEVLDKAEYVRLKLIDAQKQLPADHEGHPSNHPAASKSKSSLGASSDMVTHITSGITAEKLMYEIALEKGHSAAVNEISGIDLPGCEIDYATAIWLLEAMLEDDEEVLVSKTSVSRAGKETARGLSSESGTVNGVEAEDRATVTRRKYLCPSSHPSSPSLLPPIMISLLIRNPVIKEFKTRHTALKRKMQVTAQRPASAHYPAPVPMSRSPSGAAAAPSPARPKPSTPPSLPPR